MLTQSFSLSELTLFLFSVTSIAGNGKFNLKLLLGIGNTLLESSLQLSMQLTGFPSGH